MITDLTPAEQARALRLAAAWLHVTDCLPGDVDSLLRAVHALRCEADRLEPPETMESLRAERDELRRLLDGIDEEGLRADTAHAENVADALRAELDEANAALARSRATHDEAEAAWGRAKQKPQVWCAGDHEPPMTTPLLPLLDKHGRRWSRWYTNCWCCHNEHGKQLPPHPGLLRWRELLNDFGPLTEVIR